MWNVLFLVTYILAPLVLARTGSINIDLLSNQSDASLRRNREYLQLLIHRQNKDRDDSNLLNLPLNYLRTILENVDVKSLLMNSAKSQDNVAKPKLFGLITRSKKAIEDKFKIADRVHAYFKNNHVYKLGYLVGRLKSNSDLLTELYELVKVHLYEWDNLKILDAYEQMHKTGRLFGEIISTLKSAEESGSRPLKSKENDQRIAWDYYDES